MKIALASSSFITKDLDFNVKSITDTIKHLKGKADLVVFGEAVLQGFDCLCWNYQTDKDIAKDINDPLLDVIKHTAKDNKVAVSFGMIEKNDDSLFSSQVFINDDGQIIDVFHRVSEGWKEVSLCDEHYKEGKSFYTFKYKDKTFITGLCGDLFYDENVKAINKLEADAILWPIWRDCSANDWNKEIRNDYIEQSKLFNKKVLVVNPSCLDNIKDIASGGRLFLDKGKVIKEDLADNSDALIVEI